MSDPNFTFEPYTVYNVYEDTASGANLIGTAQQLDPAAPGPERWAINPWCGKKDTSRYASRWVAAERLLQIHKEHFKNMQENVKHLPAVKAIPEPSPDEPLPPVYDIVVGRVKLRDNKLSDVQVFIRAEDGTLHPIEQGLGGPGLPLSSVRLETSPHNPVRHVTCKLRMLQDGK